MGRKDTHAGQVTVMKRSPTSRDGALVATRQRLHETHAGRGGEDVHRKVSMKDPLVQGPETRLHSHAAFRPGVIGIGWPDANKCEVEAAPSMPMRFSLHRTTF